MTSHAGVGRALGRRLNPAAGHLALQVPALLALVTLALFAWLLTQLVASAGETARGRGVEAPAAALGPGVSQSDPQPTGQAKRRTAASAQVTGIWEYRNRDGTATAPVRRARVEVRRDMGQGESRLLGTGITDVIGQYSITATEENDNWTGGATIYVNVVLTDDQNSSVRVTYPDGMFNRYWSTSSQLVASGDIVSLYGEVPAEQAAMWYIYDKIAVTAYDYLVQGTGWLNNHLLRVRATTQAGDPLVPATNYDIASTTVNLIADDIWDQDVFLHEFGHFAMHKLYVNYPNTGDCANHRLGERSNNTCAWAEGWATFLQGTIQSDSVYEDRNLGGDVIRLSFDMEADAAALGPDDEGAVIKSLWDVLDAANAGESWDNVADANLARIWAVVQNDRPINLIRFWDAWKARYPNSADLPQAEEILRHHEILTTVTDVQESNVLATSLTISWATSTQARGRVRFTVGGQTIIANDARGENFLGDTHSVPIQGLAPSTAYSYSIESNGPDGQIDDNYVFQTGPVVGAQGGLNVITGLVREAGGATASDCVVFAKLRDMDGLGSPGESLWVSALSNLQGYVLELPPRTADRLAPFDYQIGQDTIVLYVLCASRGTVTTQVATNVIQNGIGVVPDLTLQQQQGAVGQLALVNGWNLVALPVEPLGLFLAEDLGEGFNAQGWGVNQIVRWDDGLGKWTAHLVGRVFNNFALSPSRGYFVRTSNATGNVFNMSGRAIESSQRITPVVVGWNLIAVPYPTTYLAESLGQAMRTQGLTATQIVRWNSSLGSWSAHLVGWTSNNFAVERGAGYFVRVTAVTGSGEFTP